MNAILVAVVGYTNNLSAILLSIAAILLSASRVKSSARNLRKITRKIVAARILSRKMLARVKRPAISCARKLRKNLARGRPALQTSEGDNCEKDNSTILRANLSLFCVLVK